MTVSDRKTTNESQSESQTGLTSDHDLSHEDLCEQRKVIEDINKDIHNISLKLLSNSEDSEKHISKKERIDNTNTQIIRSDIKDSNEALILTKSAQPIDSTNRSVNKIVKTIVNDFSGDQQLTPIQKKVSNQTKDDMNHVTQNDKNQQLRHNDNQQNEEEMMDTAVDTDNTIRTDGIPLPIPNSFPLFRRFSSFV